VASVKRDYEHAAISEKLKALIAIAAKVQRSGKEVTADDVARARRHGATDLEIQDTVLITGMFALCNRYVDGLATWAPEDPEFYRQRAAKVAADGYAASTVAASAAQ
jgi:alkylhydroperoxidase family enzyme